MRIFENKLYLEDVDRVANIDLPWEKLKNKSVLITGATGLIGSFIVDVLMAKNNKSLNCHIYALGRNIKRLQKRFDYCIDSDNLTILSGDVNKKLDFGVYTIDYIVHLASNTHPVAYAKDPIGTITTNVIGLYNLLEFAVECKAERFAFASSNEIYGENRGDIEKFNEEYCGYIDCNTMRAGYPESKRCGEALCQAYLSQKNVDVVIPRLTRSYGPTLLSTDTKALSQFLHKAIAGEDIVLKSAGTQYYSYTYVADAVSGLLTVLLKGNSGEAYNISDEKSDITLKDLAAIIADIVGRNVIFDLPDEVEVSGFSKATKARLESKKLQKLGWKAIYNIEEGIQRTIAILKMLD